MSKFMMKESPEFDVTALSFMSAFANLRKEYTADQALRLMIVLCAGLIASSENPDRVLKEQVKLLRSRVPEMVATLPRALEEIAKARKIQKSERRSNKGLNKWQ
jgi:hypothetical protein